MLPMTRGRQKPERRLQFREASSCSKPSDSDSHKYVPWDNIKAIPTTSIHLAGAKKRFRGALEPMWCRPRNRRVLEHLLKSMREMQREKVPLGTTDAESR